MDSIKTAWQMALELQKNYTWDAFAELMDFCSKNDVFFFHDEDNARVYIEDDYIVIA